jgi:TrmH family RNA methyltransferase
VLEALRSGAEVVDVFVSEDLGDSKVEEEALRGGSSVWSVSDGVMKALTDTTTPQGVAAVVRRPSTGLEVLPQDASLVLLLVEVRDPGNAGTLIRSAVAAGADAVVFTSGSVDPFGPKTVRSTAGMLFHVPVITEVSLSDACDALHERGLRVVGAEATADQSHHQVDLSGRIALALGNETQGFGDEAKDRLDEVISIAMPGPAESLNVGIAGSILLFEAVRQRSYPREP